ncbi:MAG TPA: hypothetical protein VHF22_15385, partial [Planctomycetota bacterium]|nr:hypothetical protein [Planctomycetota bacterium]
MSATTGSARFSPEVIARGREIFNALKSARRVLVTSEPYPDGDAFGTELALDHVCRHAFAVAGNPDARVYLVNEKGCPRKYRFMSGSEKIRKLDAVFEEELARERERVEDRRGPAEAQRRWDFDVGIVVDGGAERAGPAAKELFDRCKTRIIID